MGDSGKSSGFVYKTFKIFVSLGAVAFPVMQCGCGFSVTARSLAQLAAAALSRWSLPWLNVMKCSRPPAFVLLISPFVVTVLVLVGSCIYALLLQWCKMSSLLRNKSRCTNPGKQCYTRNEMPSLTVLIRPFDIKRISEACTDYAYFPSTHIVHHLM